ncbi:MAG: hypothetical protein KME64_07790 [Scytonematopsis contorta HA4267-MV1]|nr:hypothetical protein [Scytonematopsis contorta HA4267-MV1]
MSLEKLISGGCLMIFVPGYVISTDDLPIPIYEGSKTVVYRGIREEDKQPVIVLENSG